MDKGQEELITVSDSVNEMTFFHVNHCFEYQDWYYNYVIWSNHMLAATLWIDKLGQDISVKIKTARVRRSILRTSTFRII